MVKKSCSHIEENQAPSAGGLHTTTMVRGGGEALRVRNQRGLRVNSSCLEHRELQGMLLPGALFVFLDP